MPHQWKFFVLQTCSEVLLIDEMVGWFKQIDSFVRKLRRLGFELDK